MLRHFSRSITVTSLLCALWTSHALAQKASSPSPSAGETVITVGGKAIKRSQIDTIVDLMAKAQAQEAGGEIQPGQKLEMRKLVATNLIGQELLEQEAKALHIQASPKEIDS